MEKNNRDETSYRLNLTIPSDMKESAVNMASSSLCYNGLSDLLGCAIREYSITIRENAAEYLKGLVDSGKDAEAVLMEFKDGMSALGERLYDKFRE